MNPLIISAFEMTYGRAIDPERPFLSALSALLGWQYKFKYEYQIEVEDNGNPFDDQLIESTITRTRVRRISGWDNKLYNYFEQLFIIRWPKNFLKLGTEFVWNLAYLYLKDSANNFGARQSKNKSVLISGLHDLLFGSLSLLCDGLSILPWALAALGKTLTSPLAATRETYRALSKQGKASVPVKVLAFSLAAARGLFAASIYGTLGIFVLPALASGALGSQIGAALVPIATALANIPIIASIGAALAQCSLYFAGFVGLASALPAAAATMAATTIGSVLSLTGIRTLFRHFSPFETVPVKLSMTTTKLPVRSSTPGSFPFDPQQGLTAPLAAPVTTNPFQAPSSPQAGLSPMTPSTRRQSSYANTPEKGQASDLGLHSRSSWELSPNQDSPSPKEITSEKLKIW